MEDIAIVAHRTGAARMAREADPLSPRLIVTDPASREEFEVGILKEALWRPPVHTEHGLLLSLVSTAPRTAARSTADPPGI
ncbi:hypothetical protein [Streptomyces sp. BPSDS2]|uniref:hypothetical protein n=1 Tax=Streptomyces sp. BPSDS2 TaxID=2571021 RepID=UPI001F10DE2A|nr:hypothetical protein [Streptomyces sp. BPSDS2]